MKPLQLWAIFLTHAGTCLASSHHRKNIIIDTDLFSDVECVPPTLKLTSEAN